MAKKPDGDRAARMAFAEGDLSQFDVLATPHLDALYSLCLHLLGDQARAEDAAQEALVRCMTRYRRYDPDRPFRPWLLRVGANLCKDRLRSVWWRRWLPLGSHSHDQPTVASRLEDAGRDEAVSSLLQTLPPHYREAVTLFHLQDMSYAEMVEVTGASEASLKQRVRRGRAMLGQKLRQVYPEFAPSEES